VGIRGDHEVIVLEQESGSVKWLLLGAALGAGLALLFAPASGQETRKHLSGKLRSLRDSAEGVIDDLRGELDAFREGEPDESGDQPKAAVEATGKDGDEAEARPLAPGRRRAKVSSAREELERRLAEARARRHGPLGDDEEPVA
jgi:gas vesicle protein